MKICNLDPFVTNESITFLADIIKENLTYWGFESNNQSDLEMVNQVIFWDEKWFIETAFYRALINENRTQLGKSQKDFIKDCNFGPFKSIGRLSPGSY